MGFTIPRIRINRTLVNGTAIVLDLKWNDFPLTVFVNPAVGDTVAVSYSLDGGVTYSAWPNGPVTSASNDILVSGATHLKFQRTAGTGTTSTFGVC